MQLLAVLAALPAELSPLWASIQTPESAIVGAYDVVTGNVGSNHIVSLVTGVGKVRAAAGVQSVIDYYEPEAVLFVGAAGGLESRSERYHVIVGNRIVEHDFDIGDFVSPAHAGARVWETNPTLVSFALTASQRIVEHPRVRTGVILTGDQVIVHSEKRDYLREKYSGDCIEMEGAAVALVCSQNRIPFVVVRIVSDSADKQAREHFVQSLCCVGTMVAHIVRELPRIDAKSLSAPELANTTIRPERKGERTVGAARTLACMRSRSRLHRNPCQRN